MYSAVALMLGLGSMGGTTMVSAQPGPEGSAAATERIQKIADDLRARLTLQDAVRVVLVVHDSSVVSVQRAKDAKDASEGFVLSFEEGFLDRLTDDELSAAIAHELGHVWIFTHHPYLQTEEFANQIALRVVTRSSLESVYEKVWARRGTKGTLSYFPNEQRGADSPEPVR
jgi:hypothetical protein